MAAWPRHGFSATWTACAASSIVLLRVCVGRGQEFGGGERIEVEHLSPGELPVANLVQAKNGSVKLAAGAIASALMPQHHDLILARSHHPGAQPVIGRALEWIPRLGPARPSPQRCLQ